MTTGVFTAGPLNRRRLLGVASGAIALGAVRPSRAQEATPATPESADVDQVGPARLASLLALVPADVSGDVLFTWADLETQLDAAGLRPLGSANDLDGAFIQATQSLALGHVFRYAALPEYEATFGFAPVRVDQTMSAGEPGNSLTLLQGRFSERALRRAWEQSGYRPVDTDDGTVWSWADGPEVDPSSPVGQFGVGALNNAAILPDDTVVFAPTVALVAATLTVAAGNALS